MSQPIVVTLPHRLGKAEAQRRLQASFSNAHSSSAGLFMFKNQWSGDHLHFRASLLGHCTTGKTGMDSGFASVIPAQPWPNHRADPPAIWI